nr:MAG: RNA-dependent RNA polymerase [Fusarium oxysporum f. sp. cubense ourmia-like virus 3]
MARPINPNLDSFWSATCRVRRRFVVLVRSLNRVYDTDLPVPTLAELGGHDASALRDFCSGPMEGKRHLWRKHLNKVEKRPRYSIMFSLFLFRKTIPSNPPSLSSFFDKVTTEPPAADPLFMEFVRREVPKMFKHGWDKSYDDRVANSTIGTSACSESSRAEGGCRMYWLTHYGDEARKQFCSYLRGEKLDTEVGPSRLTCVESSGKHRIVTCPPHQFSLLKPLHAGMYDHLSRKKWLLRGDAKASRFSDFVRKDGEVFVSGDYEAATDTLNPEVQKEILRLVLQNAIHVPNEIRILAMRSLSHDLRLDVEGSPPRIQPQRNGQMMGYLLSFPLLCIVNYLSFRYATMDDNIPVKINGDDIVFRARREVAERWMDQVSRSGLTLSRGKTLVDSSIFTLNSTLFASSVRRVRLLPFVRSRPLFMSDSGVSGLQGRFSSFAPGFYGERRRILQVCFLRENVGYVDKSGKSLTRGLGCNVSCEVLKRSHLWTRECTYLELPKEKPPAAPPSMWACKPEGYEISYSEEKHRKVTKEERLDLTKALVDCAWSGPTVNECEESLTLKCPSISWSPAWGRLLRQSRRAWRRRIHERNTCIWDRFVATRTRYYPYFRKVEVAGSALETAQDEKPVPPIELGGATVWDCRPDNPVLRVVSPGAKVKIFRLGVGIGPPTCF